MEEILDERKKILVPLVTEKEDERSFLDRIADSKLIKEVILLFVVDKDKMGDVPAGFVGTKIKAAEDVMEKIKKDIPNSIKVQERIEWGVWLDKISSISKLEKVDEIFLVETEEDKELLKELREREFNINTFIFQTD